MERFDGEAQDFLFTRVRPNVRPECRDNVGDRVATSALREEYISPENANEEEPTGESEAKGNAVGEIAANPAA
uniref:Uncharacterized protein n=1 Tax=Marseillevirus LCMAC103 TaxID=2506604 RepID=A0A481YUR7_9VIRU|nr:MAG: hypothetical protein LCMAC103_03970 [Marseillevirus LCMAC103]